MTSVEDYFNKRFGDMVAGMSEGQMLDLLKDLIEQSHWIAIMKYLQGRRSLVKEALYTIDPIKDPTLMARTQGSLTGLSDLEDMLYHLNKKVDNDEN